MSIRRMPARFLPAAVALGAIALVAGRPAAAQNLIVNGGFETGDFTGWTKGGPGTFIAGSLNANSGSFAYSSGAASPSNPDILSQTFDTVIGQEYVVTFYVKATSNGAKRFAAAWDGVSFFSEANSIEHNYQKHTFTQTATSATSTLRFTSSNFLGFWGIDDVSVTGPSVAAVPEPGAAATGAAMLGGAGLCLFRAGVRRRRAAA